MKILIVGAGSIGKRHLNNLIYIGVKTSDLVVVETRKDRQNEIKSLKVKNIYVTIDDALKNHNIYAAIICSPTSLHIEHAIQLATNNVHLMIEKPLANNLNNISELEKIVSDNNIMVLIAYIFRFSPLTKKVKELLNINSIGEILYVRGEFSEYLPDWHPYEDYRSYYMAEKTQGGGSILDQSHIMDLIHYLFGGFKTVSAFNSKLSSLEINADDTAEMIVNLKSGVLASIHTDIFGREHKKVLEIKGEEGNIVWDFYANSVSLYDAKEKKKTVFNDFSEDFNIAYIDEINHFIKCCKSEEKPIANLQDGIETMELILSAERSQESNKIELVSS